MSYDKSIDRNRRSAKEWIEKLHACSAPGCMAMIPAKMLMCLSHWRQVSPELRRAVSDSYHSGSRSAYLAARKAAIESVKGGQS